MGGTNRKFRVGDLVDAKDRHGVHYQDGVVASVGDDDKYTYHVVRACGIGEGSVFSEDEMKLRDKSDAWRVGYYYLDDLVSADDGTTRYAWGKVDQFVADSDRPYRVSNSDTGESGFFGDAHLALRYRSPDSKEQRFKIGDWVVADDGEVRYEDAVIGKDPSPHTNMGTPRGVHYVYPADGDGDVRQFIEEHLSPREHPVPQSLRDPDGIIPDHEWIRKSGVWGARNRAARAASDAAMESIRQSVEARSNEPSPLRYVKPEPPKRPLVSGFRGVLMWFTAVPVVSYSLEAQAPGVGGVVGLILLLSSLGVVPLIANRRG